MFTLFNYKIGDHTHYRSELVKDLGVSFDTKLNFNDCTEVQCVKTVLKVFLPED